MEQHQDFETLMQKGVDAHSREDYETALSYRLAAFAAAPPQPWDRGRAARDIAASFDRLGDTQLDVSAYKYPVDNDVLAEAYSEYAYRQHAELRNQGDERGSREFTVSAMYAAIVSARQEREEDSLGYIQEAWAASEELKSKFGKPHQYDVNLAGRVAGIEGAFSKPMKSTREIGKRTIQLAKISETSQVLEPNTRKTELEVKEAQRKALIRGWAARSIVELQSLPTRRLTKPIAKLVLDKVVL